MAVITITDATFQSTVIQAKIPVIVEFTAVWSDDNKLLKPNPEEVSEQIRDVANQIKFARIDIDDNPTTTSKYNVRSVPLLTIFENGELIVTRNDIPTVAELNKWINDNT